MAELENLSPPDFQNLSLDLAQAVTGNRFEAFGPGRDDGMDGRLVSSAGITILQAKHYKKSSFSSLVRTMRDEAAKIKKHHPNLVRYILFTSQSLSPGRKKKLLDVLNGIPVKPSDILGCEDIEGLLRKYPDIHKAHIKLWLSSAAVLERLLNSGLEGFTKATQEEISKEVQVYVQNPSYFGAIARLKEHKVLIISGPPGVGKTTLARILIYQYINADWRFYAIRSLSEGFAKMDDDMPTIFFFDDFLGTTELDRHAVNRGDSELALFVKRIQKSKNARLILTSRAHIFEEASLISGRVSEPRVQVTKFILNLSQYTRRMRAQILYNHLAASDLTRQHFSELLKGDWIKKIVDHKNYSPRVVSMVTTDRVTNVIPEDFPKDILKSLDDPNRIWEKPYRALCPKCQHLLIALFFSNERGETLTNLQANFGGVHETLCQKYNRSPRPRDYYDALKILESGFISISNKTVQYVNPAVRDFMNRILQDDPEFLFLLPAAAMRSDWAQSVWEHSTKVLEQHKLQEFSELFFEIATRVDHDPRLEMTERGRAQAASQDDLPLGQRIRFLVSLAVESTKQKFLSAALEMIEARQLSIIPDDDGQTLPIVHRMIRDSINVDSELGATLLRQIEELIIFAIEEGLTTEGLIFVHSTVNESFEDGVPLRIRQVLEAAVNEEEENIHDIIAELESSHELEEHLELLQYLEELSGMDLSEAIAVTYEGMVKAEDREWEWISELDDGFRGSGLKIDFFCDRQLTDLFQGLIHK